MKEHSQGTSKHDLHLFRKSLEASYRNKNISNVIGSSFGHRRERELRPRRKRRKLPLMKKPTSFDEAFEMLDRAIHDISEPPLKPLIKTTVDSDIAQFHRAKNEMIALGIGHVEDISRQVVEGARRDPLLYIGAAALVAGVAGFLISSKRAEAHR